MSNTARKYFRFALAAALIISGSLVLIAARSRKGRNQPVLPAISRKQDLATQGKPADRKRPSNLSLQAEAFTMSRRMGTRFSPGKLARSVLVGTLTIGSERHTAQISRTQTEDGENVEINLGGLSKSLTWDRGQGTLSAKARASGTDRELIERLALDSPDRFVLAQLEGASYFTVGRNVRPANAGENYTGPLWNIIRVNDPEQDDSKRADSSWRLYYVNTKTGLIDRIESEVQGQRVVAELSGWTDQNGEMVPARIVWRRQDQTIMEYQLTNFTHARQ